MMMVYPDFLFLFFVSIFPVYISNISKYGNTALLYATHNGHGAVVDALLKAGANVNIVNNVSMLDTKIA